MPNRYLERLSYGSTFGYLHFFAMITVYEINDVPLTYAKISMLFFISVACAVCFSFAMPAVMRKLNRAAKES